MKSIICFAIMLVSMIGLDLTLDMSGGSTLLHFILKTVTSLLFVLAGIFAIAERKGSSQKKSSSYSRFILTGLVLGFAGDVLIDFCSIGGAAFFAAGLFAFVLGHVFYMLAFSKKAPFRLFDLIPAIIVAVFVFIAIPASGLFLFDPPPLFYALIVYGVILALMVTKAFGLARSGTGSPVFIRLTAVGAVLFALSDVLLLFIMFMKILKNPENIVPYMVTSVVNLLAYYLGQGFIALSLRTEE